MAREPASKPAPCQAAPLAPPAAEVGVVWVRCDTDLDVIGSPYDLSWVGAVPLATAHIL